LDLARAEPTLRHRKPNRPSERHVSLSIHTSAWSIS
jgi:hypothetical protein